MQDILTIHITVEGCDTLKSPRGQINMIRFGGFCDCDCFRGEVLPGGVDTQRIYPDGNADPIGTEDNTGVDTPAQTTGEPPVLEIPGDDTKPNPSETDTEVETLPYDPDLHPGDKEAEANFKDVNEAYSVLSDPEKKAKYDQYGHAAFDPASGAGAGGAGGVASEIPGYFGYGGSGAPGAVIIEW